MTAAIDDPVIVGDPPSVELPLVSLDLPSVTDEIHSTVDAKFSVFKDEMQQQFRSFFDQFIEQLEVKLSSIRQATSQVSSASIFENIDQVISSQDVNLDSFSAPSSVAVQSEHNPDRGPAVSQRGDVGVLPGWAAASGSLSSGISLPQMLFRDVEGTVCYFQLSGENIPDQFLETLCSVSVVSEEHNFIVVGDILADALFSAVHSRDRSGSLVDLLYHAVSIASASPVIASCAGVFQQSDAVGSLGVLSGVPPSSVRFPLPSPWFASSSFSAAILLTFVSPRQFAPFPHPFPSLVSPIRPLSFALFTCSLCSSSRSFALFTCSSVRPPTRSLSSPARTIRPLASSLSSPVRPVHSFPPSFTSFTPVFSFVSPVVTLTTSSSLVSSSCSLVFSSASSCVSSGSLAAASSFLPHSVSSSSSVAFVSHCAHIPSSQLASASSSAAPRVPDSAPSVSVNIPSSSGTAGPRVCVGSQPGTSGAFSPYDVLRYADNDERCSKDDSDTPFDKAAFTKRF